MIEWYDNLSTARGIDSIADVQHLTQRFCGGYRKMLAAILPERKNAPIYDAGCGPGMTLNILKSLGYTDLEGTDLSSSAIALAKELGFNASQANSIDDLAERMDRKYSCIFAVDFIEHLEKPDLLRFIQIAHSKLAANGVLVLRCPNGDSPLVGRHLFNDLTHVWTYTSTALSVILNMSGFVKIAFLDETMPFMENGRYVRKMAIRFNSSLLRLIIKAATRENIGILAPSFWIVAQVD